MVNSLYFSVKNNLQNKVNATTREGYIPFKVEISAEGQAIIQEVNKELEAMRVKDIKQSRMIDTLSSKIASLEAKYANIK